MIERKIVALGLVLFWVAVIWWGTADACEEPHAFMRVGAGYAGSFDGGREDAWANHDDLSAQIDIGFRWPIDNWAIDARIGHHSSWFVGPPFNNDEEAGLDYLTIGAEYRLF